MQNVKSELSDGEQRSAQDKHDLHEAQREAQTVKDELRNWEQQYEYQYERPTGSNADRQPEQKANHQSRDLSDIMSEQGNASAPGNRCQAESCPDFASGNQRQAESCPDVEHGRDITFQSNKAKEAEILKIANWPKPAIFR